MSGKFMLAKVAANVIGSIGVSKVVNDIITKNTAVTTTFDAVRVWAGSIVIGSMIAEQASNHVNSRVDTVINWYQSRNNEPIDPTATMYDQDTHRDL